MFRAMIPPIYRSTRLCVTACGIIHSRCCRPVAWKRGCVAACILGVGVRIPSEPWMSVWMYCSIRFRSLRRADHSSRGVLPSVVCLSVTVNFRQWGGLDPVGLLRHGKQKLNNTTQQLLAHTLQSAKFEYGQNFMPFRSFFCGFKYLLRDNSV